MLLTGPRERVEQQKVKQLLNGAGCDDLQVELGAHPAEFEAVGTGRFGLYGAHEGAVL